MSTSGAEQLSGRPPRARIAGVEAGVAAGLFPSTSRSERDPAEEALSRTVPLPDWTDPPTREVPRVLLDPGSAGQGVAERTTGPIWREVEADWQEDDLFADLVEEAQARVLDEDDPWLTVPSRPAAGLVNSTPGDAASVDPAMQPGPDPEPIDALVEFDETRSGLRARVAWAGRVVHRRRSAGDEHGAGPDETVALTQGEPARAVAPFEHDLPPRAATAGPSEDAAVSVPDGAHRSPLVATAVGLAFGALALVCFLIGPPAVLALVCVVLLVATAECYQALRRARYRPAALLGLVAAPAAAVAGYLKGTEGLVFVAAVLVGLTFLWYLVSASRRAPVANIAATLMGWAWVGFLGGFAGLIVSPSAFGHRTGLAYLLGALEATVAYDVGGYAIGSWLGRHKLAPSISPNKTWEGLAGGCAAALVIALSVTTQMHPWTLPRAAALGVVVAVLAPLGDLTESLVKRDLKVKDMGALLPAHGGLLDRVDAIIFVLPATYFLVRLFHG